MLLYRSASALYLERLASSSKLLFSFKNSNLLVPSSCSIRIGLVLFEKNLALSNQGLLELLLLLLQHPVADGIWKDTFYAAEGVSWTSLGVSDNVSRALVSAGIQRPSLIQVHGHLPVMRIRILQNFSRSVFALVFGLQGLASSWELTMFWCLRIVRE
ncbi:DEAD-box ATP-dependent RNA helicase 22, partial [Cucurbita argyrosperma subsp. sororia]